MKETIIPSAIVAIVFGAILIGAGIWVFQSGQSEDPQVADAQQQAQDILDSMSDSQTGESYEIVPGLSAVDVKEGEGEAAAAGQLVAVKYEGKLENGTVFDASDRHPDENGGFTFPLGGGMVIRGWDLGVVGMKPGGVRILTVSPELGYGDRDLGAIPPNSTLIFTVEMIGVVQ